MPFQTKSFELKVPKVNVPKESVRTITLAEGITAPKIASHADFSNAFNSSGNTTLADAPRRIIDVQGDQRFPVMYMLHFAVSIYAALDVKSHPTITPMSIFGYMLALYHAFHLCSDKYLRGSQSRHVTHFLSDDDRRSFHHELLSAVLPSQLESFLRLNMPSTDPRRPEMRFVPSYAAFNFQRDFGRFFPTSFALTGHNILSTTQANSNPNFTMNHWLRQNLASNGSSSILAVGNLLGFHYGTTTNEVPNTWFYTAVSSVMSPIVARTIAQRYVFSPVPFDAPDFNDVSNLSIGPDGSVNTVYDVNDINPYILALSADLDNLENMRSFIMTMSQNLEDAHIGSCSLGKLLTEESNVHILGHCYSGPALPTWNPRVLTTIPKLRSKPEERTIDTIPARSYAIKTGFLDGTRAPLPTKMLIHEYYPTVPTGWKLLDSSDKQIPSLPWKTTFYSLTRPYKSTDSTTPADPDKYISFNARIHYVPEIRILLPFDANPSESYIPQICGRIIETGEIDSFSVRHVDTRMTLSDENAQFLPSAIVLQKVHKMTDLQIQLVDRYLPDPEEEAVSVNMYNASEARFGRAVSDLNDNIHPMSEFPIGHKLVDAVRSTDLLLNRFAYSVRPNEKMSNTSVPNIPDGYIYAWSPYRFVSTRTTSSAELQIFMLVDFRPHYGLATPLMSCEHPSIHFPKN